MDQSTCAAWKSMEWAMSVGLRRVKTIVSPWLTHTVGPGTVPLKVQASYVTLVAMVTGALATTRLKCLVLGITCDPGEDCEPPWPVVMPDCSELSWLCRLAISPLSVCDVSAYAIPPATRTSTSRTARTWTDDIPFALDCICFHPPVLQRGSELEKALALRL